jgi:D-glycero-D-manno-heptose 1,7-bisphosphate phosphatase
MGAGRLRRAVFLDRDGVINRNILNPATGELEAPLTVTDFRIVPGVLRALRRLKSAGFLLFLVSNQPNAAKGKSTIEELRAIHALLCRHLCAARVGFTAFYYCFHHPEGVVSGYSGHCECRKPSPYFLLRAEKKFHLDLSQCWMVGDRATDVACGQAAGTRTILIQGAGAAFAGAAPDHIAINLAEAADLICTSHVTAVPTQIPSDSPEPSLQSRS